ncbi:2-hydroxyacid dehydrogenase [Rhizobiaceae bacterium BDR2-2]|uniref:2-hydroxyacid dehydrogenase n=1 Tax=Ectorhizobium quercum TaxID=2965071 RepID=A0AAE3MYL4_9HYPH|nr:2-hydroxyacid dehydrogenase [Ectorhizobium quercum]MCX8996861.1 2-hydroxyacid dehydrogenase [Ectorhizobium quercum]
MTGRTAVLVYDSIYDRIIRRLEEHFDLVPVKPGVSPQISPEDAARVRGAAVYGKFGADWIDLLPNLEIVANFGVGYDGVDYDAAAKRGIVVTNTPDVLNDEVADSAVALLLNTIHEIPRAERWLRSGNWEKVGPNPLSPMSLKGRTVGLYGLGRIGLEIARRLEPFKVKIAYHTRSQREGLDYAYYPTLLDLAKAVDTLICIVPGTPETRKAINADVLSALGSDGVFINVGRGTSVDDDALIAALRSKTISAAGLDVFSHEPKVPEGLLALDNAVLWPHIASATVPTRNAMGDLVADNIIRWFAEGKALTPVPETPASV